MEGRDLAIGGIGFLLGLVGGAWGAKKIPEYLEGLGEKRAKTIAGYMFEELKKEGLLQYTPKQNPQTLDPEKIYKALEELTAKINDLEKKLES